MNDAQETFAPENFRQLTELHDMAANACELLKAMANEWRLMILCQLNQGEMSVGDLAEQIGINQSPLSQHLARMRHEGVVTSRREAQTVYYSIAEQEVGAIVALLYELFCEQK